MELNDEEKELESFFSDTPSAPEEEVEEREVEEEEAESEEGEGKEEEKDVSDEPEEVSALTAREQALIAQFTETSQGDVEEYDPSVPPAQTWESQQYQFLKEGDNIDDILADPAKLNAKMQEFYNDALQRGAQMALEATYRSLPRTISTYAKQQIETVNLVNSFYESNKDLVPLKPALARIAQKIGTEHPEYTISQLLDASAKAARTIFKVPKTSTKPKGSSSPAFVGQKGGANRVSGKRSGGKTLEDEVMDLIS